ncbi:MAG TPA: hypothetical protein VFV66_19610 [Nonomuraea sp.]|nr:hypothetical protein [Nonomuraea sp.]
MTKLYSVVSDLCTVFTTHDDIGTVASLIGAVPLTVDYRTEEAYNESTVTILRWGDGILVTHPYYSDLCARQEVLSALSRNGRLAVCVTWGMSISPWSKTYARMDPWRSAGALFAYFAYAANGRLEVGFDPADFDKADPSARCGWNTGAVDAYLHDLDFSAGSISQHACIAMLERIAGATFPEDHQRPAGPHAGFTIARPLPAMSDAEVAHFMGPPLS